MSRPKAMRTASTLSPEQLERKRANDRESQRAIRARTKNHIARLERENRDLRLRGAHLETVMQQKEMLEVEVQRLRGINNNNSNSNNNNNNNALRIHHMAHIPGDGVYPNSTGSVLDALSPASSTNNYNYMREYNAVQNSWLSGDVPPVDYKSAEAFMPPPYAPRGSSWQLQGARPLSEDSASVSSANTSPVAHSDSLARVAADMGLVVQPGRSHFPGGEFSRDHKAAIRCTEQIKSWGHDIPR